MEARNWIGIVIIFIGLILQPIGWMYYLWAQTLSFALIIIGALIFATQKFLDKQVEKDHETCSGGQAMPGDIHDYSGWGKGGRSDSWISDQGDDSGGAGD